MVADSKDLPPERQNLVRELICPQLFLAIVAAAAFSFTVYKPVQIAVPTIDASNGKIKLAKEDPLLNSEELLEKVANKKPSKLFTQGKVKEAREAAWKAAKDNKKRQSVAWNMAIGNVLCLSDDKKDRWKGYTVLLYTVEKHPKATYPRLNFARKLYEMGRIKEAEEQYESLLKLSKPEWVTPRLELANIYLVGEKTARSVELFNEVLKIKPNDSRLVKRLGLAIACHGDKEKGFEKFVEGCTLESDNQDYPGDIKKLIDDNAGLIENAINEIRMKLDKNPDDIDTRITLAKLLIAVNRLPAAKTNLEKALEKRETVPEIHEVLSEVLFRLGQKDKALAEFNQTANFLPLSRPAAATEKYAPTIVDTKEEIESRAPPAAKPKAEAEASDDEKAE